MSARNWCSGRVEIRPRDARSASTRIRHREKLDKIARALQKNAQKPPKVEISDTEKEKLKEIMKEISRSEEKFKKKPLKESLST